MATVSATSSSRSEKKRKYDGERNHIHLGMSDFDKIIKDSVACIDKTMFIKEWMEAGDKVSLFLRPRRFGKSTNLSMLKSFFSFGAELKDFGGYFIAEETDFIEKHRGKYPVVSLNMKEIRGDDWGEMLSEIWSYLRDTLEDQKENLNEQDVKFIGIDCYNATAQPNEATAARFLKRFTKRLQKKYKQKVIVLIDDFDAPLNHAFLMGFYEKTSSFFAEFYSNGLKDNSALKRACLMGIVDIRGGKILSGLNNVVTYPCDEEEFSQYFGFSKEEITTFLEDDKEQIQSVREWYDGYYIGSCQVINPWSFMSYMKQGILKSYWTRTANIDPIHAIINPVLSVKLIKILAHLYEGNGPENGYEIGKLSTIVNYGCSFDLKLTLCFLVHAGYLTYNNKKVFMPNLEVKNEWVQCSFGVTDSGTIDSPCQQDIMNALQADPFQSDSLETVMNERLQSCSFFDTKIENYHHMFYFGLFTAVCGSKATFNREAGHGQYDIGIALEDMKRLFLFEFKHSKTENALENDAKDGLKQIHEKQFYKNQQYCQWTCYAIGVSFFNMQMSRLECDQFQVP